MKVLKGKRFLAVAFVLAMLLTIVGAPVQKASAATVKLNKNKVVLAVGETFVLSLKGTKAQSFTSSNKKVATVNEKGVIKGVKVGKSTVSVKGKNGKTYKCSVTVEKKFDFGGDNTITVKFTDGTKKSCKVVNGKIETKGKKIASVILGSYPATRLVGDKLTDKVINAKYDKNGNAVVGNMRVKRISKADTSCTDRAPSDKYYFYWGDLKYSYFKYEPIEWKVVAAKDGNYTVVSAKAVDTVLFNEVPGEIDWDRSTIRSWLNGYGSSQNKLGKNYVGDGVSFYSTAFTTKENKLIADTWVKGTRNLVTNVNAGRDKLDRIYLFSDDEVVGMNGFSPILLDHDANRVCLATDYVTVRGAYTDYKTGSIWWWCRTPGDSQNNVVMVNDEGSVVSNGVGVDTAYIAVRPSMVLDLSKIIK